MGPRPTGLSRTIACQRLAKAIEETVFRDVTGRRKDQDPRPVSPKNRETRRGSVSRYFRNGSSTPLMLVQLLSPLPPTPSILFWKIVDESRRQRREYNFLSPLESFFPVVPRWSVIFDTSLG